MSTSTAGTFTHTNRYTRYDLHTHTHCSDGQLSPEDLVSAAAARGIEVLAVTDHDTLSGIPQAQQASELVGLHLITGVEVSAQHLITGGYGKYKEGKNKIIHVLGLDLKDATPLDSELAQIQQARASRGEQIVTKLAALLPDESRDSMWHQVVTLANGDPLAVGRTHIAQMLASRGVVKSVQQAFDHYLADDKPAYVAIETLALAQTITLIHASGGLAVLAHPTRYKLSANQTKRLIADFARLGGDAIELPSSTEKPATRQMIDRCVADHGLLVSIGSDYHGDHMPWRRLGDVPAVNADQKGVWEQFSL